MGIYGLTGGNGLPDVEGGATRFSERNANDWARDWAAARARAGAVGPPDSIGPFGLLCFGMTTCMVSAAVGTAVLIASTHMGEHVFGLTAHSD